MVGLLIDFLILVIVVCVVAAVLLWAIQQFFPTIFAPARYVIGAVALIAILIGLKPILSAVL